MIFVNFATLLVALVELHHLAGLYRCARRFALRRPRTPCNGPRGGERADLALAPSLQSLATAGDRRRDT